MADWWAVNNSILKPEEIASSNILDNVNNGNESLFLGFLLRNNHLTDSR